MGVGPVGFSVEQQNLLWVKWWWRLVGAFTVTIGACSPWSTRRTRGGDFFMAKDRRFLRQSAGFLLFHASTEPSI
jgi:hypothetical protein